MKRKLNFAGVNCFMVIDGPASNLQREKHCVLESERGRNVQDPFLVIIGAEPLSGESPHNLNKIGQAYDDEYRANEKLPGHRFSIG